MTDNAVGIIGAGPAGLAAAIQLKRSGIEPVVFEKTRVGGLLHNANLVENYPGFPDGITGPELVGRFVRHAERLAVAIRFERVVQLACAHGRPRVTTDTGRYDFPYVIAASGTRPIHPDDPAIPHAVGDRVVYEVADLADAIDRDIAIIGGGDAAFDYALNLARRNRVTILHRGARPRALPLLIEQAGRCEAIEYCANTTVEAVSGGANRRLVLHGRTGPSAVERSADILVIAVGRQPDTRFVRQGPTDGDAPADRIFWCGDVVNGQFRQVSIAVADGVRAAMAIARRLGGDRSGW